MSAFDELGEEFGASVIEDAAQAFGAKWRGRKAGSLGRAAAFSFYPTKNLGASGDGGCVATDDPDLRRARADFRNHGSQRRYYHEEFGWNSRLDALQCAILRVKLRHLNEWNDRRRAVACAIQRGFRGCGIDVNREASHRTARRPLHRLR